MSDARNFHVSCPHESGLARWVLRWLGRPEWDRVPWVHADGPIGLDGEIAEDSSDFPAAMMDQAAAVSVALRESIGKRVPHLFATNFAFYPTLSASELSTLLRAKGFQELAASAEVHAAVACEPDDLDAMCELLSSWDVQPAFAQQLMLELLQRSPQRAARVVNTPFGLSFGRLLDETAVPREAIAAAVTQLAALLPPGVTGNMLSACAKAKDGKLLVKAFLAGATRMPLELPHMDTETFRMVFPRCGPKTKLSLLKRDSQLVDLGVSDTDATVRTAVAPTVSDRAHIAALLSDGELSVSIGLARNARLDSDDVAQLSTRLPHDAGGGLALALARHASASEATLAPLARHPREDVRSLVARHPNAGGEAIEQLSCDSSEGVRAGVASRGDLSDGARTRLRQDGERSVSLAAIAGDKNASDTELATVPHSLRIPIREEIAKVSTDSEYLARFALDAASGVRLAVAANHTTPQATLHALCGDGDGYVRAAVASHPNATPEMLGRLAVDSIHQVRQAAARSLGKTRKPDAGPGSIDDPLPPEIEEVLLDPMAAPRRELSRQKHVPAAVVAALAEDPDIKVRKQLVRSSATPPEVLDRLALDSTGAVRALVAACPRVSRAALAMLVDDESFAVRAIARARAAKQKPAKQKSAKQKARP